MSIEEVERLNPHFKWNWRKIKKRNRKVIETLTRHGYFRDCNGHPCKVTGITYYGKRFDGDVEGQCLIPGKYATGCSIFHCVPEALTEEKAKEMAEYYIQNGQLAYLKKYDYICDSPEAEAELETWYESWGWRDKENP